MENDKAQVAILTPLSLEYAAVRHHLTDLREVRYNNALFEIGQFKGKTRSLRVVIQQIGPRNAPAAQATSEIIHRFEPSVLLLVGIAGGVKDAVIGDVIVATQACSYESGKETAEGFKARPVAVPLNRELRVVAESVARAGNWLQRMGHVSTAPHVFFGTIAAGDKVVATEKGLIHSLLKEYINDALCVEMEAIGFAEAASHYPIVRALIIRGISDLLENKTQADSSGSQQLGAENAAAFAFELLDVLDNYPETEVSTAPSRPFAGKSSDALLSVSQTIFTQGNVGKQVQITGDVKGDLNIS